MKNEYFEIFFVQVQAYFKRYPSIYYSIGKYENSVGKDGKQTYNERSFSIFRAKNYTSCWDKLKGFLEPKVCIGKFTIDMNSSDKKVTFLLDEYGYEKSEESKESEDYKFIVDLFGFLFERRIKFELQKTIEGIDINIDTRECTIAS